MEQETIEPEYEELNKEFEIKMNDDKLKIKLNEDGIIFSLIIGLSCYKYIRKFNYKEIIKEFGNLECKNIKEVYEYFIERRYKIINDEKKIIIDDKKEIKLNEIIITDHELIKILVDEIRELKEKSNKQNEIINELTRVNADKENKIIKLENQYIKRTSK